MILGSSFLLIALAVRFASSGKATAAVCAATGMVAGTSSALCTQALPAYQGVWLTDAIVRRQLKRFCSEHIPVYMVPDLFRFHQKLPKTSTDKIDYQALLREGA